MCDKSAGSALLRQPRRIEQIIRATSAATDIPITFKTRKGYNDGCDVRERGERRAGALQLWYLGRPAGCCVASGGKLQL